VVDLNIIVENGTLTGGISEIVNLSSNNLSGAKTFNLTFENVTFNYTANAMVMDFIKLNGYENPNGILTTNIVLNNCTIDLRNAAEGATGTLFNFATTENPDKGYITFTINGGIIKANDFDNVTIYSGNSNDIFKLGKGSDGNYTKIELPGTDGTNVLAPCTHEYVYPCDVFCNVCGQLNVEAVEHDYSVKANDAGFHWLKCSYCGVVDNTSKVAHSYSYICDESCNDCSYTRDVTHDYTVENFDEYGHWLECSVCGFDDFNSDEPHEYSDSSDETCNHCSYARVITHVFDGDCDSYCNDCGDYRTTSAAHVYDGDCDSSCNICFEQRTTNVSHVYDNSSDDICNVCGLTRPIEV